MQFIRSLKEEGFEPVNVSLAVESYLERASVARVPGRGQLFYYRHDAAELPKDKELCGVRLESDRVWLEENSTGLYSRMDAFVGKDGLVPVAFLYAELNQEGLDNNSAFPFAAATTFAADQRAVK